MSWIMRFLSSDIVIPFRVWGPRNSSHNGRKSKGITPECFDVRPLPCPHNPPRPLPPSRGEAASSKSSAPRPIVGYVQLDARQIEAGDVQGRPIPVGKDSSRCADIA